MKGSVHEDAFYSVQWVGTHESRDENNMDVKNNYLYWWLILLNGVQYGTPYSGCRVGNRPKFMPLNKIINRDILKSLHFNFVLSRFVLKGEGNDKEKIIFSYSTLKEIAIGLNHIW